MQDAFDQLDSVDEIISAVTDVVDAYVTAHMTKVAPEDLGLDRRCSAFIYLDDSWIAVPLHSQQRMEYYGGFEYVDRDCVRTLGDYVFYSAEHSRVEDIISTHNSK